MAHILEVVATMTQKARLCDSNDIDLRYALRIPLDAVITGVDLDRSNSLLTFHYITATAKIRESDSVKVKPEVSPPLPDLKQD